MFARRTLSFAVAALALGASACLPSSSPQLSAAPDARTTLDAAILPPHYGQVPIHLSKASYIALFEVIPGRGVSLLYPQSGSGFVQVREAWVPLRYHPQRWMYANNHYSSFNRINDYGYGAGRGSFNPGMQAPRYLFLVASEDPIAVEQFQGEIGSIRQYLGHAQYTSMRAEETMEELAFAILPYMSGDRWVSDVYVDWGFDWGTGSGFGTSAAYTSWQPVMCSNGSIAYAPWRSGWGFDYLPCMPMQWVGAPGTNVPVVPGTPQQPGDSTVAPPSGEERRRADASGDEQRERANAPAGRGRVVTDEVEIRATLNQLREQGQRARVSDDLSNSVRESVRLRQRADAAGGGGGPVVSRDASGRPAPVTGASSNTARRGSDAGGSASGSPARSATEERRREARREQIERDRREEVQRERENARRRTETSRPETSRPAAAPRREPASRPAPETRSTPPKEPRQRPSSPPPSSGNSSGSSGGRSRTPPPAAS